MTRLPDLRPETYFSRRECIARHHLTAPDARTTTLGEPADDTDRDAFEDPTPGCTETVGDPALRTVIARTYEHADADDVIRFARAEEALHPAMNVLLDGGDHAVSATSNHQAADTVPLGSPGRPVPAQSATRARIGEPPRVWILPHRPESVGTARRITNAALDAWGIGDETTDRALLVVSELVTNAVEHALPPVALHLLHTGANGILRIEVHDGGPAADEGTWTASCTPEEHGRGGDIVALLASAHGTHTLAHGVTYWADLPLAG
ncbi:ATP-binding protein [Embleya sp. NBC_00896]|uniref:ATP-binding protein n=1 Tax=Embleya sp. NBC_00896 TaxID=2975961 RepID=UPI00386DD818|nr:ATP-binding protein [Embleya sp. NBC_00896]